MCAKQIAILMILSLLVLVSADAGVIEEILAEEQAERAVLMSACVNNLNRIGLVLHLFAAEHEGRFPGIDDVKGNLIFEADQLYPEFMTDVQILGCPGDTGYFSSDTFRLTDNSSHSGHNVGTVHADCITSESYIYLGWLVSNEEEGLTTIAAYRDASPDALVNDIEVPMGKGNGGGDRIYRLRAGVERYIVTDINTIFKEPIAATVPIVWEWPSNHGGGGSVLYMDGHVEFVSYPGKFPMTEEFIETLRNLEAEISGDCFPVKTR